MAKNFFQQILNKAGIKSPDANGYYDPSVYVSEPAASAPQPAGKAATKAESSTRELTRVEKYLASKNPEPVAAEPEAAPSASTELTGVAKYLARLQQEAEDKAAAEAETLANMTGVARYLAMKEGRIPAQAAAAPAPEPEEEEEVDISKLTGVERYLALQKQGSAKPAPAKPASQPKAEAKPAVAEQPAVAEEPVVEAESAPEAEEAAPEATAGNDVIDLAANAEQCQAATTKGTQCRRKTGLESVEKTIDGQRYTFAVCGQHNNDGFTPVEGLVE